MRTQKNNYLKLTKRRTLGGCQNMKKSMVGIAIIVLSVFLIGCLDYKAYEIKDNKSTPAKEASLAKEIEKIEKEVASKNKTEAPKNKTTSDANKTAVKGKETAVKTEEKVLPEVTTSVPEEDFSEKDMPVIKVKEDEFVRVQINVSDPDKDPVTYTFSKPLSKNGEWKTNYGDAGEYIVTITATDKKLATTKKVKLVVERINVAPLVTDLRDLTYSEGEKIVFDPKVKDPNNDPVTVRVSEPLQNGTFMTDHTSAGIYTVVVTASDGELETKKSFKLTVNNINQIPEVTNLKDVTVKEGETVKLEPKVTDLDEDKVKLTITEPVGNDGMWETTYTDHGKYLITVTADDGKGGKVTKNVNVIVEDVNVAPEIKLVTVDKS